MSKGNKQKVCLVQAFMHEPEPHVEIHFDGPVPADDFKHLSRVFHLKVDEAIVHCIVDGMLDPLFKAAARHSVARDEDSLHVMCDYSIRVSSTVAAAANTA